MMELITNKDIQKMYLETEHGIFTPLYTYESYDPETETYQGFEITKAAEEVYKEWLENKDKPVVQEPTEIELLQQENKLLKAQVEALSLTADFHEELIAEMAMVVYA